MKKYKGILYDLDCTLLDTMKMNMIPLQRIIKEEKNEDWAIDELRPFMAYTGMKVMDILDIKDKEKTYARWVKYVNEFEDGAKAFPHVEEVLSRLHNKKIKQAVVSSKLKDQYQIDFVSKGLDKYMDVAVLADDTPHQKPDPEPIELALKKLHLNKDEVIYIGDAYSDYQACVNAGVDFGLATWGSFSDKGIHPTVRLNDSRDILKLVKA
ncbi:MAG: HAD family hydrolase [Allobaculum sp.]